MATKKIENDPVLGTFEIRRHAKVRLNNWDYWGDSPMDVAIRKEVAISIEALFCVGEKGKITGDDPCVSLRMPFTYGDGNPLDVTVQLSADGDDPEIELIFNLRSYLLMSASHEVEDHGVPTLTCKIAKELRALAEEIEGLSAGCGK